MPSSSARGMGYDVGFKIWRMSDFGISQKRERVIFVGARDAAASLFEQEMEKHTAEAPAARDVLRSVGEYGSERNPRTCAAKITLLKRPVFRKSAYNGFLVNGAGRIVDMDDTFPTLTASMGGNATPIVDQFALDDESAENWFVGYRRRLLSGEATPDETVPDRLRRLTIAEAAAVQSFPSDYSFCGSRAARYRQIGNAVPPLFAYAVAKSVIECFL